MIALYPRRALHGIALIAITLLGTLLSTHNMKALADPARPAAPATKVKMFTNPVFANDFPDPFILKSGKTYYAYASQSYETYQEVPMLTSLDLVHWRGYKEAMPVPPFWVGSDLWAPAVFRNLHGKYVMWFSAVYSRADTHCVGFATSTSPSGPFKGTSTKPQVCQPNLGGDIDPDIFRDSTGQVYLLWKNDGDHVDTTSWLWAQKLNKDGTVLQGRPVKLDASKESSWEGNNIEAPFLWKHDKSYYLFYSGNAYLSYSYSVGYATCKTPMGPCKNAPNNPILMSNCRAAGPGGETIITDAKGQPWMAYAAWVNGQVGDAMYGRRLWLDRLGWVKGKPVVHGPTCKPQPAPSV